MRTHHQQPTGCRRRPPGIAAAILALTLWLAAGCGDSVTTPTNTPLTGVTEFTQAGPSGATTLLADLTTFPWTQAYYFVAAASPGDVERIVGQPVAFDDDTRSGLGAAASYLVFVNDGTIAGVGVATPPLFLDGAMGQPYDVTTAEVVVTTSDPGPYTAAALR